MFVLKRNRLGGLHFEFTRLMYYATITTGGNKMKMTIKQNQQDGFTLKTKDPMSLDESMEMIMTAALAIMNDFASKVPDNANNENTNDRQKVKEALYDNFNEAASTVLSQFMPDKELRPDLTEEAIKDMEDEIMRGIIEKSEENKNK